MSTNEIVTLLESERTRLDRAIEVLRGTHQGKLDATGAGSRARRGGMSLAARKAQSERMKRYWAAKRRKGGATASKKG
jgi:hypothetical protein